MIRFTIISTISLLYLSCIGPIAFSQSSSLQLAETYMIQEDTLFKKAKYPEAMTILLKVKQIYEAEAPNHHMLTECYWRMGRNHWLSEAFDEAETWWRNTLDHSLANGNTKLQVRSNYNLGLVHARKKKLDLALEHYLFSLNIMEENLSDQWESYLLVHNGIGGVYIEKREFGKASYYLENGFNFLKKHKDKPKVKANYNYYYGLFLKNLGSTFSLEGNHEKALIYLKESLTILESTFGKKHTQLIRVMLTMGDSYRENGEFSKAYNILQRALRIAKTNDYDIVICYGKLGKLHMAQKKWELAQIYFDSSITALNSKKESGGSGILNLYALAPLLGKIEIALSTPQPNLDRIEVLHADFMKSVRYFYATTDKQRLLEEIQETLRLLYMFYADQYQETSKLSLLDKLWEITETNKSIKLRSQLRSESSQISSVPQVLIKRSQQLKDSINKIKTTIGPNKFDSTLSILNRKYDNHIARLERDYPDFSKLKNTYRVSTITQKKADLKEGELLLNFFEGKHHIYALELRKNKTALLSLERSEFSKQIGVMNSTIFKSSEKKLSKVSQKIRQALRLDKQHLRGLEKLIIIPDGIIWNLNFSALSELNNNTFSYLGNELMIVFDHFSDSEVYQPDIDNTEVLAFSFNPLSDCLKDAEKITLRDLSSSIPGTSMEVVSISKGWNGEYFYAQNANETTFKNECSKYQVLHLAVHGFQDAYYPENSYLKFAAADSINDGLLHAYEILNLNMNADMAVLSACHSGNGKIVAGEGMMSLGRAFAYAGVRSLIISRWEVSDYSAPYLMEYFYKGLKTGMYKSEALKYAQTEYLRNHSDALTGSPFYWSSFYVLGDDSPLHIMEASTTSRPLIAYFMIFLAFSATIAWARIKFKHSA